MGGTLTFYDEPLVIEHAKRSAAYNMAAKHYHGHYEIYYMLAGERTYFIKDAVYEIKQGDLLFIDRNELHRTAVASSPAHERILINFSDEVFGELPSVSAGMDLLSVFRGYPVYRLNTEERELVEGLLFRMLDEDRRRAKGYRLYQTLLLAELLLIAARLADSPRDTDETASSRPLYVKISEVLEYMHAHFAERITLDSVAKRHYMSYSYLSRTFKQVTGFSFTEYLNRLRIKEAERLLRETTLSITEVADRVGYESLTHFERSFKSVLHMPPMQYRKLR